MASKDRQSALTEVHVPADRHLYRPRPGRVCRPPKNPTRGMMVDSEPSWWGGRELVPGASCTICVIERRRETMGTRCVMVEPKNERTLVD